MDVIRHDDISKDMMACTFQKIKLPVYGVVSISNLDKRKPFVASEGDKVNTAGGSYLCSDSHDRLLQMIGAEPQG